MSDSLIRNLRDLAVCAHADLSVADEAADEIERLREALRNAYQDCLDAVAKVKADPLTEAGVNHKSQYGNISAKDWMVAFAEDVEREIKARTALGEEE